MTLDEVRAFALSLPEATESPHFDLTSFRVGGKIFATAPKGGTHLHVFVPEEVRAPMLATEPDRYEALRWGNKVVGLRIPLRHAPKSALHLLLRAAWCAKAPKHLLATQV